MLETADRAPFSFFCKCVFQKRFLGALVSRARHDRKRAELGLLGARQYLRAFDLAKRRAEADEKTRKIKYFLCIVRNGETVQNDPGGIPQIMQGAEEFSQNYALFQR